MTRGNKPKGRRGRGRSGELTYYAPAPEPAPAPPQRDPDEHLHGYTLAAIQGLARGAAAANAWHVSDFMIRFEAAWDAIVDELLTCAERPEPHDLARIGKGAVSRTLLKDFCHTYGVADRDPAAGMGSAPRFAAYWFRPPGQPLDERVCELVGLRQAWAALSERHARNHRDPRGDGRHPHFGTGARHIAVLVQHVPHAGAPGVRGSVVRG
jgi:hypothetical protein